MEFMAFRVWASAGPARYNILLMNRFYPRVASRLLASFGHAARGLGQLFHSQPNARIHLAAAFAVLALAAQLRVSRGEWMVLLVCIGLVLAAEALNSSIEALADALHPERHPGIGRAKDLAAAGVLIAALAAAAVGLVVFWPYL